MGASPQVSFTVTGDLISAKCCGKDTICLFTREKHTMGQAIPTPSYTDYTGPHGKQREPDDLLRQGCCSWRYLYLFSRHPVLGQTGAKSINII